MRLLSARSPRLRLHRDLALAFDPRFTVIAGPNPSAKSTTPKPSPPPRPVLAVKTGGSVLDAIEERPFHGRSRGGIGLQLAPVDSWVLRANAFAGHPGQRFACRIPEGREPAGRGGRGTAGPADWYGSCLAPHPVRAAEQLKERWGPFVGVQGSSATTLSGAGPVPATGTMTAWSSGCRGRVADLGVQIGPL